ncbi:hypothetical protein [Natronolimnohabitans innermongolicus]|uniref:hypothetical protein n=1 Tax=Natronolimnohabitans innermongolicus TaxID=253107 RepID=UPI0013762A43|nr:hypothetical protein [Natronolimnohabitans innermongolicus]
MDSKRPDVRLGDSGDEGDTVTKRDQRSVRDRDREDGASAGSILERLRDYVSFGGTRD